MHTHTRMHTMYTHAYKAKPVVAVYMVTAYSDKLGCLCTKQVLLRANPPGGPSGDCICLTHIHTCTHTQCYYYFLLRVMGRDCVFSLCQRILMDNRPQASVGSVSGWRTLRPISECRSPCCLECNMQFSAWGILNMEITLLKQVKS